jgi:hypothetical protein
MDSMVNTLTNGSLLLTVALVLLAIGGLVVLFIGTKIGVSLDARKNLNDVAGANSQNFIDNRDNVEKAFVKALEIHRKEVAKEKMSEKG